MRTLTCTREQCSAMNRHINGMFHLYPDWNENQKTKGVFIGRKMPNGRVFIGYGETIEMYEPGEYEEVTE